jgi:hypothetical protein
VVGNVESLTDLKVKTPRQLRDMATKIIREHASRKALAFLDNLPEVEQDETKRQWTMWNMDVLPYLQLRDSIKMGDIGRMQDLLPTLLFRFAGGGNPKYTIEVLELLQGLNREWTPELKYVMYIHPRSIDPLIMSKRTFITEFCWVMSRTGKENTCLPFDMGQEENICDIKVSFVLGCKYELTNLGQLPIYGSGRHNGICKEDFSGHSNTTSSSTAHGETVQNGCPRSPARNS